jgi:hypothetical protein
MAGRMIRWSMTPNTFRRYRAILQKLEQLDPSLPGDADEYDDLKGDLTRLPGFPHIGTDEYDTFVPDIMTVN